jgi:hypothetical protein
MRDASKIDRAVKRLYIIGNKPATPLLSKRISGRYFFALRFETHEI